MPKMAARNSPLNVFIKNKGIELFLKKLLALVRGMNYIAIIERRKPEDQQIKQRQKYENINDYKNPPKARSIRKRRRRGCHRRMQI